MCQPFKTFRFFGYRYANFSFSENENLNCYCAHNDSSCLNPIKLIFHHEGENFITGGLMLFLSQYLSLALNMSIRFVREIHLKEVNYTTGIYNEINGDIFANNRYGLMMTNFALDIIRPIASPLFYDSSIALMSIQKPNAISISEILHIFDIKVYYSQLICVFVISLFLRYCRQASAICRRSLLRQYFEIFLLATFEPRAFGLLKEKALAIRLILTALILVGFLMKKTFCSKLNSLFAFQSYTYVESLEECLENDSILKVVAFRQIIFNLIKNKYNLPPRVQVSQIWTLSPTNFDLIKQLLEGETIAVGPENYLSILQFAYPFLPLKTVPGDKKWPVYRFPILKDSRHFRKLYYCLQATFETGIYHYASRQVDQIEKYHNRKAYTFVEEIYQNSTQSFQKKFSKDINCLKLSTLILVFGIVISGAFLFLESVREKKAKRLPTIASSLDKGTLIINKN